MSAALALEGIVKTWEDGTAALSAFSLTVSEGELVTVLGPSGSGKSTALRVVAGLEAPDAGRVTIGGRDVTGVEPSERGVAMVFQSFALFPHLSVEDNIGFGLRARGSSRDDARSRARVVAGTLGLGDLLARRPSQLSGGERQRVALARGLAGDPQILLLDEPLSNLDARLRAEARAEIRRVQEATGVTMLYVTHDQDEALALGHRVAVLDAGELQQVGTPDEVYDRPANRFVASFVGEPPMNLIDAASARVLGIAAQDEATVGFRPESVLVDESCSLPARCLRSERQGDRRLLRLAVGDLELVAFANGVGEGDEVRIAVEPSRVLVFDGGTGEVMAS